MLELFIVYLISINLYATYALYIKSSGLISYLLSNPVYDLECGDSTCECRNRGICYRFTGYVTGMSNSESPLILGTSSIRWVKA